MHEIGSISVVLPTYREQLSIRDTIMGFYATGIVDEVIVVENNAERGTREAVAGSGARIVAEHRQGYGYAIMAGLDTVKTKWVAVCEPDGTFIPKDIHKLTAYAVDFDYVIGTRTTPILIWHGANMRGLLRWGNWGVAKIVELLYNTPNLTDVGCTFRLFKTEIYRTLRPHLLSAGGSDFGLVLSLLIIRNRIKLIEVPLNYCPRVGISSVTGHFFKAIALGWRMLGRIFFYRFFWKPQNRKPEASGDDPDVSGTLRVHG